MEQNAYVSAIWLKPEHRAAMQAVNCANLIAAQGLEGNINRGGKRQVTLIESEIWSWLMDELGAQLPPVTRRANLMLTGISLKESKGKILHIGSSQIRIMGETKPCKRMEQALTGLKNMMEPDWRGGAYGQVIHGGTISNGDMVSW